MPATPLLYTNIVWGDGRFTIVLPFLPSVLSLPYVFIFDFILLFFLFLLLVLLGLVVFVARRHSLRNINL